MTIRRAVQLVTVTVAAVCLSGTDEIPSRAPDSDAAPSSLTEQDAVEAYYRADMAACLGAYRAVLEREPENASALVNLARVLRETGELEEALERLDALLVLLPEDERARLAAAETAVLARQPERALRYLQAAGRSARALYVGALALMDLGQPAEALARLTESLELESFQPMAWYWSALLEQQEGHHGQAEDFFHKALSQERNLMMAYYPLALAYLAQEKVQTAYDFLGRAAASLPRDGRLRELRRELEQKHPELADRVKQAQARRRETATPRAVTSFPEGREALPQVRIGLAEEILEMYLKTGGAFSLSGVAHEGGGRNAAEQAGEENAAAPAAPAENAVAPAETAATPAGGSSAGDSSAGGSGEQGAILTARLKDGEVEVSDSSGALLLRSASPVRLAYDDPGSTTIVFDIHFGGGTFWAGSEDRMYRGVIELAPHPAGLTVINTLSLEEYLYSVLPSEMPSHWPAAALQAQAVAARTYTLANLGRFASRGFDLSGSVSSAAYRGMSSETDSVRAAVDATRGLALMNGGKLLPTFYSANCGGFTETTESVWGFATPLPAVGDLLLPARTAPLPPEALARWLADRPESYSANPDYSSRSAYRWTLWVPRREIESRLDLGDSLGSIRALLPGGRGFSGRVREVLIRGTAGEHTVKGDSIRRVLGGLRSNLFTVDPKMGPDGLPEYFIFTGGGWGHGVGLCQSGAAGMAVAGFSAADILHHYYGEAELRRLY